MNQQNYLVHGLLTRGTIAYKQGQRNPARKQFEEVDVLARERTNPYYIIETSRLKL